MNRPLTKFALLAGAALSSCGPLHSDDTAGSHLAVEQQGLTVCPTGTVVYGVDVSVFQGIVDWASVKGAGKDFAIARISDGSFLDTQFAANWSGMKNAGLVRGAYQFFEPGEDPTTQANIVISAVGVLGPGDLPVTADMEVTGGQSAATIAANLSTWVQKVQAGTGKAPMVYTAPGYWNASVNSASFGNLPLWGADWGPTCPDLANGWSNWEVWQYSDMGSVSGISATVDLDEFNGTLAQLQTFAGGGAAYAAQFVSQTWPYATTTITLTAGTKLAASITMKNVGTATWDSATNLATTQPRNRTSPFAAPDWRAPDRPAGVTGTVPPRGTYTFSFDFQAPTTPGSYDEFFGMVEDAVAWFSDPGQGGPPDNDIEAKFDVVAAPDAGPPPPMDAGSHTDAGSGGESDGGSRADAGEPRGDAGAPRGEPDAGTMGVTGKGCGCGAGATGAFPTLLALLALAAAAARRVRAP